MWPEMVSQGSLYARFNQESRYATPLDEEVGKEEKKRSITIAP